jgi:hypothetical protein
LRRPFDKLRANGGLRRKAQILGSAPGLHPFRTSQGAVSSCADETNLPPKALP